MRTADNTRHTSTRYLDEVAFRFDDSGAADATPRIGRCPSPTLPRSPPRSLVGCDGCDMLWHLAMVEDDPDLGIFEEKGLGSQVMLSNPVFVKNSMKSFKALVSSRAMNMFWITSPHPSVSFACFSSESFELHQDKIRLRRELLPAAGVLATPSSVLKRSLRWGHAKFYYTFFHGSARTKS